MNNRKQKVRRRDFTADVYDNYEQDVDFNQLEPNNISTVKFQNNDMDIVLDRKVTHVLRPGYCHLDAISTSLMMSSDYWHSIIIHHVGGFAKSEINDALEDMAGDNFLVPIAYRSGKIEDTFLIHDQSSVLHNMLKKNLETIVGNRRLAFTVNLQVACYERGQIDPKRKLNDAIADVLSKFRENRLDFSHFSNHRFFTDLKFSFSNKAVFDMFCDRLMYSLNLDKWRNVINNLHILVLTGMNIKHLEPLSRLLRCKNIRNISLKNNAISSLEEFQALKPLRLQVLSVAGNPIVTKSESGVADQILNILDTLEKLDIKRVRSKELPLQEPQTSKETVITPTQLLEEVYTSQNINAAAKNDFVHKEYLKTFWSKVVIEHKGRFDGLEVLDEMFRVFFDEIPCYPCYYEIGDNEDSFKLLLNFSPLNVLVQNDLKMKMPDTDEYVTFRIHLKISPYMPGEVKWSEVISKAVEKKIVDRKLNLSNFRNDPLLRDILVNMASTDTKRYILSSALNKNLKIMEIDLSKNGINSLKGLEIMKNFGDLVCINLSHNKIETIFGFPEKLTIMELFMDKNPFCDKFKTKFLSSYDYVNTFLNLCQQLQYLDGRKIDKSFKLVYLQNYMISSSAYPAVDSFVKFFFNNFDNPSLRMKILSKALYRTNSILTVEYGKDKSQVKVGHDEIMKEFALFPQTEHEFLTMTVDTPIFNNNNILIVVNGVFKQKSSSINQTEPLFTFARTFLLRKQRIGNGKTIRTPGTLSLTYNYEIQNEIFRYESLTDSRIKNKVFKKERVKDDEIERFFDDKNSVKNEFSANLELFKQTTFLKDQWCQRFLEDAYGDYQIALTNFLSFYKHQLLKREDFNF